MMVNLGTKELQNYIQLLLVVDMISFVFPLSQVDSCRGGFQGVAVRCVFTTKYMALVLFLPSYSFLPFPLLNHDFFHILLLRDVVKQMLVQWYPERSACLEESWLTRRLLVGISGSVQNWAEDLYFRQLDLNYPGVTDAMEGIIHLLSCMPDKLLGMISKLQITF